MFQRILANYRTQRANTCMTRLNALTAAIAAKGLLDPDVVEAEANGRIKFDNQ
jgi:hypothetical protein